MSVAELDATPSGAMAPWWAMGVDSGGAVRTLTTPERLTRRNAGGQAADRASSSTDRSPVRSPPRANGVPGRGSERRRRSRVRSDSRRAGHNGRQEVAGILDVDADASMRVRSRRSRE
ncbi:hypothetical protein AAFF_G00434310 [Aldrovandia affinis]|uniref:Uncharacterized protein n=1 Tax=Aldrovandia affinis TaxID=143900 RepID=A0AAD7S836_9TELE|nr:hypothetical protein AAFF_G00434310 [Aldrovandia affinis]